MDEYNDYDDNDVNDSVDSDDDEIKFVSSKRKFRFTTFGDDDERHEVDDDDGFDGKESSIYGVFAENNRFRTSDKKPPSAPMFVRGSSTPVAEEKDDTRICRRR
jgi:hypothetical protein